MGEEGEGTEVGPFLRNNWNEMTDFPSNSILHTFEKRVLCFPTEDDPFSPTTEGFR